MRNDSVEKRGVPRINIDHPIQYRRKDCEDGGVAYLINESATGVLFAASHQMEIGEIVILTMDGGVSWDNDNYIMECEVVRHQFVNDMIFKYGMGCVIKQKY